MMCWFVRKKSYQSEGLHGTQDLVFLGGIVTASTVGSTSYSLAKTFSWVWLTKKVIIPRLCVGGGQGTPDTQQSLSSRDPC